MSTVLPRERGDGKIQGWHHDRLAVVYVRQSSRQQVADHGESTRLQYGLTERAVALGWPASRVMVIDEDLGRSAANAAERPGFARLVAELTMGHVGLVLGLEMSRLARAGRDWHQQGLASMLRNPAYAGIYAYGRSRTDPSRRLPGHEHSGRVRRPEAGEWLVRIDGALPAYISAGQYERNQARLAANRARAESPGAPREGPALLGGLVVCGTCGHRLQVSYETSRQGLTGRYCCQRRHHTYGEARCQQMAAGFLDDHVVVQVLSALAPAALELSVTAAGQAEARRAEADRIWRQRLERADFACDRARRQYQLAEPENRLVARQLEREWEEALAERACPGEEHERYRQRRPARLPPAELAAIRPGRGHPGPGPAATRPAPTCPARWPGSTSCRTTRRWPSGSGP